MSDEKKQREDFALANRAYELMTLSERKYVLEQFAQLQYPVITDRFFDAVHSVIRDKFSHPTRRGPLR